MPEGLVRFGDYRNGTPVNREPNTENDVNWQTPNPAEFGNPVNEPKNFGSPMTLPHNYGNQVGGISPVPTFSPAAGSYGVPQIVIIIAAGADAIYFTTDGSTPDKTSRLYQGSIFVPSSVTIKAISVTNGVASSAGSSAYVIG